VTPRTRLRRSNLSAADAAPAGIASSCSSRRHRMTDGRTDGRGTWTESSAKQQSFDAVDEED